MNKREITGVERERLRTQLEIEMYCGSGIVVINNELYYNEKGRYYELRNKDVRNRNG